MIIRHLLLLLLLLLLAHHSKSKAVATMSWMTLTSSSSPPISMMIWPNIIGILPQQHLYSSRRKRMSSS
jgi:hypothetical protein